MPNYETLPPGVYVEEVAGPPPIAGVGTSTAAFIGKVDDTTPFQMPLKPGSDTERFTVAAAGEPVPVTSFQQFKNNFGDFQAGNRDLAHAVFGFFMNGGTRCWVVRVTNLTQSNVNGALAALMKKDDVAIVAAPGATSQTVQDALIDHCEAMKDRFAILDGQENPATNTPDKIQGNTKNSTYAAMYFPWIQVADQTLVPDADPPTEPIEAWRPVAGARLDLPPSGHLAGIYARMDVERGVHKAPANVNVRGALSLTQVVSRSEQGPLNEVGINVLRGGDGGIKVWGARTLGGNTNGEFKYINVRRLFMFIRESLDEGMQFAVFEPNGLPLWQKIRRSATSFLTLVWRDGALFGDTPEQAFFVRCDKSTNDETTMALGQVITEIGLAVVRPAEFVIFRISQMTVS